mmetsp:Transcript_67322/g.197653  ORF Transcript_67322/g.197653 Transcript_67322/m.197653 type:complete len:315 (-) Transcript_67322:53-997(-)
MTPENPCSWEPSPTHSLPPSGSPCPALPRLFNSTDCRRLVQVGPSTRQSHLDVLSSLGLVVLRGLQGHQLALVGLDEQGPEFRYVLLHEVGIARAGLLRPAVDQVAAGAAEDASELGELVDLLPTLLVLDGRPLPLLDLHLPEGALPQLGLVVLLVRGGPVWQGVPPAAKELCHHHLLRRALPILHWATTVAAKAILGGSLLLEQLQFLSLRRLAPFQGPLAVTGAGAGVRAAGAAGAIARFPLRRATGLAPSLALRCDWQAAGLGRCLRRGWPPGGRLCLQGGVGQQGQRRVVIKLGRLREVQERCIVVHLSI